MVWWLMMIIYGQIPNAAKCPSQLLRQRQDLLPAGCAVGLRCGRREAQQQLQRCPGAVAAWNGAFHGAQTLHLRRGGWGSGCL